MCPMPRREGVEFTLEIRKAVSENVCEEANVEEAGRTPPSEGDHRVL
jgi:hypothetical protein